jgi:partner of Y14 and mago
MPPKRGTTVSGIRTKRDGERVIPASVRPDGSIRPERRVKAGYTPQEDVSVYKNELAEDFRRHQYGHKDYVPPGLATPDAAQKRSRRGNVGGGEGQGDEGIGQEEPEKKARALRKKIKAARELKVRMEKGDKLEDSQVAKVGMLETFEKELASLNLESTEEV